MADDETLFEARLRTLVGVEASLRPGDTISPQTLLAVAREAETLAAPAPGGAARRHVDTDIHVDELPRIPLDPSAARAAGAGVATEIAEVAEAPVAHREYTVLSTLGEGGMGRVHLAHQRSLARDVAVKTLKEDAPPELARALLREARLTGSLEHPGVIPVHALGVDDEGRPILVMKRASGVSLTVLLANRAHEAWAARGGGDTLDGALEILVQVCSTLELAHSRGVIHRDVKPENVMVGSFGEVYLLDWGIAATRDDEGDPASQLVGTPAYMAPEMVLGGGIDERTDVYLLGATLHEILTSEPRHSGVGVRAVFRAALASAPFAYDADVPEALASLANRATARDPTARPPSAQAFREEIVLFQRRRSTQALSLAALERLRALEALLAAAPEGAAPADLPRAYRLATEARFGLTQAERGGAGEVAAQGMGRCLRALVDLELRQGHADTADAILREMGDARAPADLAARVEELRARDAARAKERARLEAFAREHDPTALAPKRTRLILVCSAAVALIWLAVAVRGRAPTAGYLVAVSVAGNAVTHVVLALLRRSGGNRFNRGMGALVSLAFAASLVNRVYAYVSGASPVRTMTTDLVIFSTVAAASALGFFRGMWVVVAAFVAGLVALDVWPEQAGRVFSFAVLGALLGGAAVLARAPKPGN